MATAIVKRTRSKSGNEEPIGDILAREMDLRAVKLRAFEKIKDEICESFSYEELEEAWRLMPYWNVQAFAEFGITNQYEILNALRAHKSTVLARAEVGDPKVLEDARAALTAAREAEELTAADINDITNRDRRPILAAQIRQLQRRLDELTAVRREAESRLARLEALRAWLRTRAPKMLLEPGCA